MKFPRRLMIKFIDSVSKKPIEKLFIYLMLFARQKNNYSTGPFITNKDGIVVVTIAQLKKEIKNQQALYIMDYKSNINDCKESFLVKVASNKEVAFFLDDYHKSKDTYRKYWNSTDEFLKTLSASVNSKYRMKKVLLDTSEIRGGTLVIEVKRVK